MSKYAACGIALWHGLCHNIYTYALWSAKICNVLMQYMLKYAVYMQYICKYIDCMQKMSYFRFKTQKCHICKRLHI